jgi:hypothetical protein
LVVVGAAGGDAGFAGVAVAGVGGAITVGAGKAELLTPPLVLAVDTGAVAFGAVGTGASGTGSGAEVTAPAGDGGGTAEAVIAGRFDDSLWLGMLSVWPDFSV